MTQRTRGPGRTPAPPVERASTLLMPTYADLHRTDALTYGRYGLAPQIALKERFCALEGGAACSLAPSGLSAVALGLLSLLRTGEELLITDSAYGPSRRIATETLARFGIGARFYDPHAGAGIADVIGPQTRLILLESPGSLTFEIQDVPAIAAAARTAGVLTAIDATWSGGVFSKPFDLGADVIIHAATKFASGGSDVFCGAVIAKDEGVGDRIETFAQETGLSISPDDAALVLRGLHTLELRMRAQDAAARALATWLQTRPEVARVIHPALPSHPDHALWTRDFTGAGSVFGVILKPAARDRLPRFFDALEVFGLGYSYGGFESLAIPADAQLRRAVAPWTAEGPLIRLAIGLEPEATLRADLERALEAVA